MFVDRLIELDQIFSRNREEAQALSNPVVRARIAAVRAQEEAEKKIIVERTAKINDYLEWGYTAEQIAMRLKMHPFAVEREITRIKRENSEMDPMFPGWKRKSGGYVCLTPGLPTRG